MANDLKVATSVASSSTPIASTTPNPLTNSSTETITRVAASTLPTSTQQVTPSSLPTATIVETPIIAVLPPPVTPKTPILTTDPTPVSQSEAPKMIVVPTSTLDTTAKKVGSVVSSSTNSSTDAKTPIQEKIVVSIDKLSSPVTPSPVAPAPKKAAKDSVETFHFSHMQKSLFISGGIGILAGALAFFIMNYFYRTDTKDDIVNSQNKKTNWAVAIVIFGLASLLSFMIRERHKLLK